MSQGSGHHNRQQYYADNHAQSIQKSSQTYPYPRGLAGPEIVDFGSPPPNLKTHWKRWGAKHPELIRPMHKLKERYRSKTFRSSFGIAEITTSPFWLQANLNLFGMPSAWPYIDHKYCSMSPITPFLRGIISIPHASLTTVRKETNMNASQF
jgi:hypothetical protein